MGGKSQVASMHFSIENSKRRTKKRLSMCKWGVEERKKSKKTHKIFSDETLQLILNKRLANFFQNSFIQKMFFVHNRFFLTSWMFLVRPLNMKCVYHLFLNNSKYHLIYFHVH